MITVKQATAALLIPGVLIAASCAPFARRGDAYTVGTRERGIASWYGKDYHGRPTASGEIYDMYGLTAAHRTMPLRSTIRVTNRKNGRTATLRLNDRGPFIRGRTLDVSYGAAETLGFVEAGLAPVEYEVVALAGRPGRRGLPGRQAPVAAPERAGPFAIQVGAFTDEENALRLKARLTSRYGPVQIIRHETNSAVYYRVRVGAFPTERQAEQAAKQLENFEDGLDGFVTLVDQR